MFAIVVTLSLIAIIIGGLLLSEATMGVGVIAIGGVLAVYARIVQAEEHSNRLMGKVQNLDDLIVSESINRGIPISDKKPETTDLGRGIDYLKQVPPDQDELLEMLEKEIEKKS